MNSDYLKKIAREIRDRYSATFDYCPMLVGLTILQMLNHDEPVTYESLLKQLQDSEIENMLQENR